MIRRSISIAALFALLISLPAFAASPDAALYKTKCSSCHAADGSGNTPAGKSMKVRDLRSDEVQKQTDVDLTKVISGGKGKMPAYGKQLTTAQVEGLIAFIRTLKPSKGPAASTISGTAAHRPPFFFSRSPQRPALFERASMLYRAFAREVSREVGKP